MEAQAAVERVLRLGKSVRIVTICDLNGKLVYHARHKSVKTRLSPAESKASLRISARNMRERRKLARKLGVCKYTLAEYEHIKRLVMPAGRSHLMFVTCSPRFDHSKIVRLVQKFR